VSFALNIGKLVKKYNGNVDKAVKTVGFELVRRIVLKTPVDQGRLRANWQVTIGSPASGMIDTTDKQGQATIQAAMMAVEKFPGSVMWITNNLPYARRIEFEGHSSVKAPAGMVRVSIAELQNKMALSQKIN
jgi:hypothetical protein